MSRYVIGVDEVGRGALAGPLIVGAVLMSDNIRLTPPRRFLKLRDSKQLSSAQREDWFSYINTNRSISYATARISPRVIDRVNVSNAANIAATRVVEKLAKRFRIRNARVFLDGSLYLIQQKKKKPGIYNRITIDRGALGESYLKVKTIVRGDEKIESIALASIVAKVTRDRLMKRLGQKYPSFAFGVHKGYGTSMHRALLVQQGLTPLHRLSFVDHLLPRRQFLLS
ncbi:ribonuclease HII [Candidatus Jorgensenbacteria bacterium]|nr:ribonuclease HII [Candidatus Jorgensenbacteria bacterium]